ncbi:hypothetical protein [Arthrobacter sedimenti]|uniref:hypothetical protein n=1 Tax=Arthrobacter sedimenti TaxID=2694931 RepID=UPI000B34B69B|nr:hypothetical protein [Arthrobacter sedimenti]OUM44954.1 hypothetical protein B8W73_02205 [Arthrobacter agilis]
MQGLLTYTAMRHADLSLMLVWDHFLNMGGAIGHFEVDAYLHGMMTLPDTDRDCVAQAVNELLDDRARMGPRACCRAPYSGAAAGDGGSASTFRTCTAAVHSRPGTVGTPDGPPGIARRVQQPQLPVRRTARRER